MGKIESNIAKYKKPETAAKKLVEGLVAMGFESAKVLSPEKSESCGYGAFWSVLMECGPYEGLVALSLGGSIFAGETGYYDSNGNYKEPEFNLESEHWIAECYNSYVLIFAEEVPCIC